MTNVLKKLKLESPIHISKRTDMPKWKSWLIRGGAIVAALLLCGIISSILSSGSFSSFMEQMFKGCFSTPRRAINLFEETALLLCISLAVTPAFKMKFWNIGAEGQVLMGALLCATCMKYFGGKVDDGLLIVIMLVFSIVGGAVWSTIPAIFKAKWNTNETLFTLMMNYIAMGLIACVIAIWVPNNSGTVGVLPYGNFPKIGRYPYVLNIIIVAILTVLVFIYLRFSKHGYELSVVGESVNTAKYIGINVKKVIVRTMILSGALCGIAGWLIVGGASHTVSTEVAGGRGFTAILISWLAHFDPIAMSFTAFLVAFLSQGSSQAASVLNFGGSFPKIITGMFFFIIIASEFFVGYKIKFTFGKRKAERADELNAEESDGSIGATAYDSADLGDGELNEITARIDNSAEEIALPSENNQNAQKEEEVEA